MQVTYIGPSTGVTLADGTVAERGVPVDVDDTLATSLLEQSTFTDSTPVKPVKKAAPSAKSEED